MKTGYFFSTTPEILPIIVTCQYKTDSYLVCVCIDFSDTKTQKTQTYKKKKKKLLTESERARKRKKERERVRRIETRRTGPLRFLKRYK